MGGTRIHERSLLLSNPVTKRTTELVSAAVLVAAVAAVSIWSRRSGCGSAGKEILSRALSVVPSSIGDDKWQEFAADYDISLPGTSCGYLVRYALAPYLSTSAGLEQLRTVAKAAKAWVPYNSSGAPCPGAAIAYGKVGAPIDDAPTHVEIVESYGRSTVNGVSSGQGVKANGEQKAERIVRARRDNIVTYLGEEKQILGWVDTRKLVAHV